MKKQSFPVTKLIKILFKNEASTMYNLIFDKFSNRVKIMKDIKNTRDNRELQIVDQILLRTIDLDVLNNKINEINEKHSNAISFKKIYKTNKLVGKNQLNSLMMQLKILN